MTTEVPPVDVECVDEVLDTLFGEDIRVKRGKGTVEGFHCVYATEDDPAACVIAADRQFATYSAAKLLMIPAKRAEEMIANDRMDETIEEGFHEIANIAANMFPVGKTTQLTLSRVGTEALTEISEEPFASAVTFDVNFPKYGTGQVQLLSRD